MISQILLAILFFLLQPSQGWEVKEIKGRSVIFKNGDKFLTTLYDLEYIGQLRTNKKKPYLILSGRGCKACDANISIYVHSPSDGAMKNEATQSRFSYPGKEFDYENDSLLSEIRTFYGEVLPNVSNGIMWYQKDRQDDLTYKQSVYLLQIEDDTLKESQFTDSLPSISLTLKLLEQGKCKEIVGVDQTSEP